MKTFSVNMTYEHDPMPVTTIEESIEDAMRYASIHDIAVVVIHNGRRIAINRNSDVQRILETWSQTMGDIDINCNTENDKHKYIQKSPEIIAYKFDGTLGGAQQMAKNFGLTIKGFSFGDNVILAALRDEYLVKKNEYLTKDGGIYKVVYGPYFEENYVKV